MIKHCTRCDVVLTEENQKPYHRKNYVHKCIKCVREVSRDISKKSYHKNNGLSRTKEYLEKLKKTNPKRYTAKQMCSSARKRATKKKIDFNIDVDFVESICTEYCPILGVKLEYGGAGVDNSASLDRKDSSKGYTRDNLWIISSLANTMKSSATKEQLLKFGEWCVREFKYALS